MVKRCDGFSKDLMFETKSRILQLELASQAGGSGWAGPTLGQGNNRADRGQA